MIEFSSLSSNGTAGHLKYQHGIVSFLYFDYEKDKTYRVEIKTIHVRSCFYSCVSVGLNKSAQPAVESLEEILCVNDDDIYEPKGSMRHLVRTGAIVAVGIKSQYARFLVSVRMKNLDMCFVAVPIMEMSDISVCEYDDDTWVDNMIEKVDSDS